MKMKLSLFSIALVTLMASCGDSDKKAAMVKVNPPGLKKENKKK